MATIDFNKAKLAWTLSWDSGWVTAVSFLGDSRRLAAGNNQGDILIWDLPEKQGSPAPMPSHWLKGHQNCVARLQCTTDGRTLLSASYDHSIRRWDTDGKQSSKGAVLLNASPIADHEAAERRGRARKEAPRPVQAEVAVHEAAQVLNAHREWVNVLTLSHDQRVVVSGDDAGTVIVWERATMKEQRRWQVKGWVHAAALAPDRRQAVVSERIPLYADANTHYGLKLWDVARGEIAHDLAEALKNGNGSQTPAISAAAYSLDGSVLALGQGGGSNSSGGALCLVDPATRKKIRDLTPPHQYGVTDLAFHPDGKHLASAGRDTKVHIWNVATGKLVTTIGTSRGTANGWDWLHAISFSPDGHWLAAADMGGLVQIWSLPG
ncbi:MAG: WD40 repeat domain-containing protein [Gemmataceae bacterium]